jgi:hypothetical protein
MMGRAEYQAEICAKDVEQELDAIGSACKIGNKENGCNDGADEVSVHITRLIMPEQ